MQVKAETIINKPVAEVWEVMGNQYADVHLWSSNFSSSEAGGAPTLPGLDFAHRKTTTERGETIQVLDAFEPANHSLAYHISKGIPEVGESASAVWSLEAVDEQSTRVTMDYAMPLKPFVNEEMAQKIQAGLTMATDQLAEELKHYLETGTPHPRKLEASK